MSVDEFQRASELGEQLSRDSPDDLDTTRDPMTGEVALFNPDNMKEHIIASASSVVEGGEMR
jgi:hypothetical protein